MPPTRTSYLSRHLRAAERAALRAIDYSDPAILDIPAMNRELLRVIAAVRRAMGVVEKMEG
jgi:hypothetical protein